MTLLGIGSCFSSGTLVALIPFSLSASELIATYGGMVFAIKQNCTNYEKKKKWQH